MSFYDDASLVVIPSGFKTSKVYAEKPTDGSGDLTFTRTGDTNTRVGPDGLIQEVRTNLVLQSEAFNTTWVPSRGAVTANATTAPNGTTTADKFVPDTQVNPHFVSQTISGLTSGGIYTCSVYAKLSEWNSLAIFRGDSAIGVNFRLDTQAMTVLAGSPVTYSITDAGNGWYRCSMSFAIASTSDGAQFRVGNNSNYSIAGNNANGLFLWGAQYEATDFGATAYIPTTTAAVSVGPVANLPRLDYLNSSCPRLLLEPQRTNLVTNSERFTSWLSAGGTVTSNTAISPDGYLNADTLTGARYQSGFASNQYTVSCFAKKVDGDGMFVLRLDAPTLFSAQFNLNTGAIVSTSAGYTSTITNYGNGWYRCTLTTPVSTTIANFVLVSATSSTASTYIWGAQCEVGTYATSYIPTLAAAGTRAADAVSKTGITSLIGQTEGTFFVDFIYSNTDTSLAQIFSLSNGTTAERVYIGTAFGQALLSVVTSGGAVQANFTTSYGMVLGQRYRAAIAYKLNDFAFYINGAQIGTDNAGTVPAMSQFSNSSGAGTGNAFYGTNEILVFKTRLTNAELATLTTL